MIFDIRYKVMYFGAEFIQFGAYFFPTFIFMNQIQKFSLR